MQTQNVSPKFNCGVLVLQLVRNILKSKWWTTVCCVSTVQSRCRQTVQIPNVIDDSYISTWFLYELNPTTELIKWTRLRRYFKLSTRKWNLSYLSDTLRRNPQCTENNASKASSRRPDLFSYRDSASSLITTLHHENGLTITVMTCWVRIH